MFKLPHHKFSQTALATALATASFSMPTTTVAQESAMLEEVIVTARKRAENLQEVPFSVSAFTGDQLRDAQIDNMVEVGRLSPNVQINETNSLGSGSLTVYIRGIGANPSYEQGVGLYVDDVYHSRQTGALMELYDVERIEILKGPQGNLYGRNTIGGAIKYITRDPSEEFEGSLELKYGDDSYSRIKGSISGPLSDTLGGTFAFARSTRDGWQMNEATGQEYWDLDTASYRGALLWEPADDFNVKFTAEYVDDQSLPYVPQRVSLNEETLNTLSLITTTANQIFFPGAAPNAEPHDLAMPTDEDTFRSSFDAGFKQRFLKLNNYAMIATWDIDDQITLKSVTAQRETSATQPYDHDVSTQQWIDTLRSDIDTTDFSQEFQLNYTSDNVAAVVGYYYLDGEYDQGSAFTPQTAYLRGTTNQSKDTYYQKRTLSSHSVYGNVDWDMTEKFQLSLGARWTEDEIEEESKSWTTNGYYPLAITQFTGPLPLAIAPGAEATVEGIFPLVGGMWITPYTSYFEVTVPEDTYGKDTFDEITTTVRAKYQVNDNLMVYGGYAEGFKAGGFNRNSAIANRFEPETVGTYSAGFKSTLLDGSLRFNAEYFRNEYDEMQTLAVTLIDGDLSSLTRNVGAATISGFEVETMWLTPIDGFMMTANVGYLNSDIDQLLVDNEDGSTSNVASTHELGYSPELTATIRAMYSNDIGSLGELTFALDYAYQDEMYVESPINLNDPLDASKFADSYGTWNAMIALETEKWRFALEGKNLTDERELVSAFDISLMTVGGYNAPRFWSASAEYKF